MIPRRMRADAPALVLVALLSAAACQPTRGGSEGRLPPGYELPYGPSPFLPSEARVVGAEALPAGALAGSARCGECHPTIYAQWQDSLHRPAATDYFTRFAIDRMAEQYGVASTRLCVACHEPGALLSGAVDRGGVQDPATRREGISCLSCHLVTSTHASSQAGVVANGSYAIELLPSPLLFPPADDADALRRHAQALARPFLSDNRFCDSCHRFFLPTQLVGRPHGRLRLQSEEAQGTPFGDPTDPGYQSCVDCHMPLVAGDDPAARQGRIHDHRALGANVWVPALEGNQRQVDAVVAFRRAGAVDLEIGDPEGSAGGGPLSLPVVVRNSRNGHDFPTGATDISEVWAELAIRDAGGALVYRSPGLDEQGYLHPEAPSLSTLTDRTGGVLDLLHDLLDQVHLRHHPRVRPGDTQTLAFSWSPPPDAAYPLRARVVLRARHGNEAWNRWVFNWQDVRIPVTDLAEASRTFDAAPAPPEPAPPPPARLQAGEPPAGMVFVPGGTYVVGADPGVDPDALPEEWPPHEVRLPAFFLDRTPVTRADCARAATQGIIAPPRETAEALRDRQILFGGEAPPTSPDTPCVFLARDEAERYCRAQGKRLPREAEWEAAARGPEGRRYAWGDAFDAAICNTVEADRYHALPVGSFPANASPSGALDMGCNVAEWVADDYAAYPRPRALDNRHEWYDRFSAGGGQTRGASFLTAHPRARAASRIFEDTRRATVGFRCARDAGGGAP